MERPDLHVVAQFLDRLAQAAAPVGKTDLQMQTRVNYTIFQRYLAWLAGRGLVAVEATAQGERVALTARGRQAHAALQAWMRSVLGGPSG
jgi:predicted transcriptional regulator